MYQQKSIYEIDQELGGKELSLSCMHGVGNRPPRNKSPRVCPASGGGGGGMVTNQLLNHA